MDQRLDAAALASALRQALADLPEEEPELLVLVGRERLTPTEAAAAVGIPAGRPVPERDRRRGMSTYDDAEETGMSEREAPLDFLGADEPARSVRAGREASGAGPPRVPHA